MLVSLKNNDVRQSSEANQAHMPIYFHIYGHTFLCHNSAILWTISMEFCSKRLLSFDCVCKNPSYDAYIIYF